MYFYPSPDTEECWHLQQTTFEIIVDKGEFALKNMLERKLLHLFEMSYEASSENGAWMSYLSLSHAPIFFAAGPIGNIFIIIWKTSINVSIPLDFAFCML